MSRQHQTESWDIDADCSRSRRDQRWQLGSRANLDIPMEDIRTVPIVQPLRVRTGKLVFLRQLLAYRCALNNAMGREDDRRLSQLGASIQPVLNVAANAQ